MNKMWERFCNARIRLSLTAIFVTDCACSGKFTRFNDINVEVRSFRSENIYRYYIRRILHKMKANDCANAYRHFLNQTFFVSTKTLTIDTYAC